MEGLAELTEWAAYAPPDLRAALGAALRGKDGAFAFVLAGLLARGHLLLEDLPGLGKTTLAKALAQAVGGRFARVQGTPDLLPADITGFNLSNQKTREFEFLPGPVFAEVLLADEINRATPRAQSALLEAMAERQVTVDGVRHGLAETFCVLATQNPVAHHGTYPLPEAQFDRFALKVRLGYPAADHEKAMLAAAVGRRGGAGSADGLVGPVLGYLALALVGVGALAFFVPRGCLQTTMKHHDATSPLLMAAVAIPAYDPPMKCMMQTGLMFEHGNSVGAALVLLVLGAGMNLGTLAWAWRAYGLRQGLVWFAVVVAVCLALAYAAEGPTYFASQEENHTHGFDDFTNPFHPGQGYHGLEMTLDKIDHDLEPFELAALILLTALAVLGVAARAAGPWWDVDAWLERATPPAPDTDWSRVPSTPGRCRRPS